MGKLRENPYENLGKPMKIKVNPSKLMKINEKHI
jgi:hypothetical protein